MLKNTEAINWFILVGGYMLRNTDYNLFHIIFPPILRSFLCLYDIVFRF